jgi:hypothetical protein
LAGFATDYLIVVLVHLEEGLTGFAMAISDEG